MAHVEKPEDNHRVGYQGPGHYRVKIEIVDKQGHCANGHELGDTWYAEHVSPCGLCMAALGAMLPRLEILEFGGGFPWRDNKDEMFCACPDAKNPITFRLTRMREE